jgi:hypothetical protein
VQPLLIDQCHVGSAAADASSSDDDGGGAHRLDAQRAPEEQQQGAAGPWVTRSSVWVAGHQQLLLGLPAAAAGSGVEGAAAGLAQALRAAGVQGSCSVASVRCWQELGVAGGTEMVAALQDVLHSEPASARTSSSLGAVAVVPVSALHCVELGGACCAVAEVLLRQ